MSIISGTVGAALGADEQRHATNVNADNARATNDLNLQMFREGRGQGGSAILPLYAKDSAGNPFEAQWFQDALRTYQSTSAPPEARLAAYRQIISASRPAAESANATVGNIFDGGLLRQEQNNLAPVLATRNESAKVKSASWLDALRDTLGQIDTTMGRKGFTGDSMVKNILNFNARQRYYGSVADTTADANMRNAMDVFGQKQGDITRRLASLNLPYTQAQQNVQLYDLPERATLDSTAQRNNLLSQFRIAPNAFQYQSLPKVDANVNPFQIAANNIGGAGQQVGNFFANQALIKSLTPTVTQAAAASPSFTGAGSLAYGNAAEAAPSFTTGASGIDWGALGG